MATGRTDGERMLLAMGIKDGLEGQDSRQFARNRWKKSVKLLV